MMRNYLPYSRRVCGPHAKETLMVPASNCMDGHRPLHCGFCSRGVSQTPGCKHQVNTGEESCTIHRGAPAAAHQC